MTDFTKLFAGLPGFNTEAFAAAQKRNLETLVQAGQVVAAGTQTIVGRQTATLQAAVQDGIAAMQASFGAKDPQIGFKSYFEYVAGAQQKAMALAVEMTEIAQKTGQEAFELLRKRAEETTAEVVAFQKKAA